MFNFRTVTSDSLGSGELLRIVEALKMAEISRDKKGSLDAFRPIWSDVEKDPDFSQIQPPVIRAELLRLAGYFLSFYGKVESKKNCQKRAKRLIIEAINIFIDAGLKEKSDEANIVLAVCYWNSGDPINCDDILSQIEEEYADNPFDTPYLQAKLTRAVSMWSKEEFAEAIQMIDSLSDKMKFSTDKSLKLSFHNKAGGMYVMQGFYDKGINHFKKGISYALELKNYFLLGSQYNNLSYAYRELAVQDPQYYDDAFENIDKALEIFEQSNAPGLVAVGLETRSSLLLQVGKPQEALKTINRSIDMMRVGDDFVVLVEALIVRFQIKLKMKDFASAIVDFSEAVELSRLHIGDFKVELLSQMFADLVYFREKSNLKTETHNFRKHVVSQALIKHDFHRLKTAESLGIKHGNLYDILEDQMPELYEELNFEKRDWSPTGGKKSKKPPKLKLVESKSLGKASRIQRMTVPFSQLIFPDKKDSVKSNITIFYVPKEAVEDFADDDSIVLCDSSVNILRERCLVIAQKHRNKFYEMLTSTYDDLKKINHLISVETGENLDVSGYKVIGKIVAYCEAAEAVGEIIVFRSFAANRVDS